MLHTVLFSDEITLWWDKEWEIPTPCRYRVCVNGSEVALTDKTHYTLSPLTPETAYAVAVFREDGTPIGEASLQTPPEKRRLDVTRAPYFAVGDGVTMNTAALQRAIEDCGPLDCVYFPAGVYLSGALYLHSDTELYLEEGATLQGSERVADYLPKIPSRFEGIEMMCYASLINIGTLDHTAPPSTHNVVLRGAGKILGGGDPLNREVIEVERELLKDFLAANQEFVKTCENDRTIPARARGRLVNISNCEGVILAGLTLGYAASWNVHFIYSKNILTYGCRIISEGVWNGDGWDPDSSEDCTVFATEFGTHDNSIAIKSGKNPGGNLIGRPTKNVKIFDCHGGQCMAIGSEMSGGIEGVYIWDCDFTKSEAGLGLKVTPKRGGYVKDLRVRDSSFVNFRARSVTFNDDGEPSGDISVVEDVLFENVTFTGTLVSRNGERHPTEALLVDGLADERGFFRRFTFKDIRIPQREKAQTFSINNVDGLCISNLSTFKEE